MMDVVAVVVDVVVVVVDVVVVVLTAYWANKPPRMEILPELNFVDYPDQTVLMVY